MRTIIQIEDSLLPEIQRICVEKGWSRSKLIKEAIKFYLSKKSVKNKPEDLVFGMWKNKNIDAVEFQRKLRDEWS